MTIGKGVRRRFAATLAADVVGYSTTMAADQADPFDPLLALRTRFPEPRIAHHEGRIAKTSGDGIHVSFKVSQSPSTERKTYNLNFWKGLILVSHWFCGLEFILARLLCATAIYLVIASMLPRVWKLPLNLVAYTARKLPAIS